MIPNWNKILKEWSYRVGVIKPNDDKHLYHLSKILEERGWPYEVITEFVNEIDFKDQDAFDAYNKKHKMRKSTKVTIGDKETTVGDAGGGMDDTEKDTKKKKSKSEKTPQEKELSNLQDETSEMRDKGVAGAGGESASQGESRYCKAVDNLDFEKFNEENKEELEKELGGLDSRKPKFPSKQEVRELASMGLTPESDEGKLYIVSREVWAKQELKRMQEMEKPNVFSSGTGFGGKEGPYMEWMRAAYDGALATQEHLRKSEMDTSQPHQTIQSTT